MKGLLAGIVAIAVLALVIPRGDGDDPPAEGSARAARGATVATTGSLRKPRSRDGMPVFSAADVSPGTILEGTATIANSGLGSGYFSLSQEDLTDAPGPGRGRLSAQLRMEVRDVTRPGKPVKIYDGPYAGMEVRPLGFFPPGSTRRYSFIATVLRGDGEAITGASTRARYVWSALEGAPGPGKPAEPKPRDRRPPRLRVQIPRVQRLLATPYLAARVTCNEDCRLTAAGRFQRRLRAGRPAALRIRIPQGRLQAFRRTLLAGRPARLRLTFTARDGERNRTVVRRTVRLRPRQR